MPIVHVHVWEGLDDVEVEKVISGMTQVCVDLGAPPEAVQVLVHITPKTHWGKGGVPASKKSSDQA